MERFAVFGGETYYAKGGWSDFIKDFEKPWDALEFVEEKESGVFPELEWWHIFDMEKREMLGISRYQAYGSGCLNHLCGGEGQMKDNGE